MWQLQSALNNRKKEGASLLLVQGNETIRLNPDAELELDVARLEKAFSRVGGVAGADLDGDAVQAIKEAARLYQGELLPGEYQDWCVFERERLQNVYLALLDKLIHYCESNHAWEEGIDYGLQILRLDHARERTHRTLMRIYSRAGDRTAALRQYHRCLEALHEEFDVGPAVATEILYENLRNDRLRNSSSPSALRAASREAALSRGGETLERLQGLRRYLGGIDREISAKIDEIEGLGDDETRRRNWS